MTFYQSIIESISIPLYWIDREGNYLGCNSQYLKAYDKASVDELIGYSAIENIPALQAWHFVTACTGVWDSQQPISFKSKVKRNGDIVSVMITMQLLSSCNRPIGLLILEDPIHRSESVRDQELEAYFNNIITEIPGSVYWKNKEGRYLGCNNFVLEMANTKQVIGKTDFDMPWKEYAKELRHIDEAVMKGDIAIELEENPILTNGKEIVMLTRKSPLRDERGNTVGIIGVSMDITERKLLEGKLRETEVREARFKAMSAVGGMVAHELRTPLTALGMSMVAITSLLPTLIEGYEHSAAEGKVKSIRKDRLDRLKNSIAHMESSLGYAQTTISTVLANFHYGDNKSQIPVSPFPLKAMLERALSEYPFDTEERGLLTLRPIEETHVLGEEQLLVHIVHNLIKNALHMIQAEQKGKITIWGESTADLLHLYIEDTASGIAPEALPHLFNAFYTTKKETAASIGLGLYFCKNVLQKMGGDINCESQFGEYARFKITLPLAEKGANVESLGYNMTT